MPLDLEMWLRLAKKMLDEVPDNAGPLALQRGREGGGGTFLLCDFSLKLGAVGQGVR
jgi:hypothetical protein